MITTKKVTDLPAGILKSDLEYPSYKSKNKIVYEGDHQGRLKFHKIADRGWVIATLPISAGRQGYAARTYAIEVEKKNSWSDEHEIVTVGNGPHVLSTVEVYVTTDRLKALQPYIDIFNKGLVTAGTIRDRISTRRANTVARRSGGLGGFRW